MAETGLAEGFLDDDTRVTCRGGVVIYNNRFHCWSETGHGTLDLIGAITHSCNVFFYTLGQRLDIDVIARHARALGFGAPTGIDLPMEQKGVVPSREWKLKTRGEKWYAGETISVAIGQGPIRATPLQVLRAVSCMATDGLLVTPHVLLHAEQAAPSGAWPVSRIAIRPEDGRKIREGMWGSVNNYGTSHSVAIPGLDICGKTGTVQVISAERKKELKNDPGAVENHAWFAGFASRDYPEIAVVVFLEHGGGGGAAAAPIAKEMFQAYYDRKAGPGPLSSARVGGAAR
jgi:penicillin-binding protein 2